MKNSAIKKQINRRHAKAVRQIKKYWATEYRAAVAQYQAANAASHALYNDDEYIRLIAGDDYVNQYGLEVARIEADTAAQYWCNRAYGALRRYLCATEHYQ